MTLAEFKQKLSLSVEFLSSELGKIRTGRASTLLLENIDVDAYGSKMKIKELGALTMPEPQMVFISPWDKSLLKEIDKAIRESNLGVNPVSGSDTIKVPFPALTEERRKELAKSVGVKLEECRNAIRNIRQEYMKDIDKDFNDKLMGEDDKFKRKEEAEEFVKEFNKKAEEAGESKKQEIMTL